MGGKTLVNMAHVNFREKMIDYKKEIVITSENGLHTRPAARFVNEAKKFSSQIFLESNGKKANAKSLFKLQLLGLSKGTPVTLLAEGDDARQAVIHLSEIISNLN